MATPTRTQISDLRGAARLAFDATVGITDLVEKMHRTIQLTPFPLGKSRAGRTRGITGFVYRSVRGATHLVRLGVDAGFSPLNALLPEGESSATRDTLVSIVNGVYGDHLERTGNPLAIDMQFRCRGRRVNPLTPGSVLPDAGARVMLIVHGLCLNESNWVRDGSGCMEELARPHRESLFIMKYTSGSTSGMAHTMVAIASATWSRRR